MTAGVDGRSAEPEPDLDLDLSYGEAIDELEELIDDLEGADVDVDVLAARVARGVDLIRFCRARLEVVTADVDAVVAELAALDRDDHPTGSGPTDGDDPDSTAADEDDPE